MAGAAPPPFSWNSTGEMGRIGRHRANTHRYFHIRFFGPMPPDASDFPGGIPALYRADLRVGIRLGELNVNRVRDYVHESPL